MMTRIRKSFVSRAYLKLINTINNHKDNFIISNKLALRCTCAVRSVVEVRLPSTKRMRYMPVGVELMVGVYIFELYIQILLGMGDTEKKYRFRIIDTSKTSIPIEV